MDILVYGLIDSFDSDHCDETIAFLSDICIYQKISVARYECAVGSKIVQKGDKQSWTCKIERGFYLYLQV